MNFYRLKIYETRKRLDHIQSEFDFFTSEKIDNIECYTFDEQVSENEMISYFHIDPDDMNFVIEIFYENHIKFDINDITVDVLTDQYEFGNDEFDDIKKDYIKNNLTLDIVLDKINSHGLDSLNEYDRSVLESFS